MEKVGELPHFSALFVPLLSHSVNASSQLGITSHIRVLSLSFYQFSIDFTPDTNREWGRLFLVKKYFEFARDLAGCFTMLECGEVVITGNKKDINETDVRRYFTV